VLHAATRRPTRGIVLRQIFERMPAMLSPTGRKATGVIRFDVVDGKTVDTWYLQLRNGSCEVSRTIDSVRPRATIIVAPVDFVRLATGADPVKLFTDGKPRLAGDTYFGASVGELFDIPK
jgi:hypothetical protein